MQTTLARNGYQIRYSKRHDSWTVRRDNQTLQEFSSRQDAIRWAESQDPKAKKLAMRIIDIVKSQISEDTYNECLYIINNN